jgi:hypothetical protein
MSSMSGPYDGSQVCATMDQEFFFPITERDQIKNTAMSKQICGTCALFTACSQYAEHTPGTYGIWAGKYYGGTGYISLAKPKRVVK